MSEIDFPCEQEGVLELLPHRDPFVWVTRIIECEPEKSIIAELYVDPELEIFNGHFPKYPVFPGVLIMEALAQASCCCLMASPDRQTSVGYLTGIDKAKFRETVHPGDTLILQSTITKAGKRFCKASVKAFKHDKLVAEATQTYIMAPAEAQAKADE